MIPRIEKLALDSPDSVVAFLAAPPQIETYLELGTKSGTTIRKVSKLVDKAVAVDLDHSQALDPASLKIYGSDNVYMYEGSTNDFFKQNTDKFDLIFIDADHKYEQVKADLLNSLETLNEGGLIALHDIAPLREELTNPSLCNDAYKINEYIYENLESYQYIVFHYDQSGIGVLQKKYSLKYPSA